VARRDRGQVGRLAVDAAARLWQASDWQFAPDTIEIVAAFIDGGTAGLAAELRNREKGAGHHAGLPPRPTDPLHRTRVVAAGRGHEPRPVPGPLTERSDLMTQKICFDCFHKLFPDKPIRKITLGRQCVVCKAQTARTEQMIPVEAEDIPLFKQIAQVPRRALPELNGMPTGVSLFVWLPEERTKWVEMRAKRDRSIRAMFGQ